MLDIDALLDEARVTGTKEVIDPLVRNRDKMRELNDSAVQVTANVPLTEVPKYIVDADQEAKKLQYRIDKAGGNGYTREGIANKVVSKAPKLENRLFKPRGNIARVFYDKREIVGLAGPAGTGKSRGILEKIHLIAEKYANCRILICRKTRESLTEAALFTYEDQVLPQGHPALLGPKRSHRQSYLYPNGSTINVAGLDKPQKIMSTEYDIVYVQEAIECDEADFDLLGTRLRNGVVPYQQLLFDCNPDAPTHWLYQNALANKLVMYDTEHEDNPRWFEAAPDSVAAPNYTYPHMSAISSIIGRWTDNGEKYIARLDGLTGARKLRLRFGKWAAAEGQIYDSYNAVYHLKDRFNPPINVGRWVWTVDFGWSKPFVLQMWWIDGDGRAWLWRSIYYTQRLVEDHAKQALEIAGWGYDEDRGHYELPDADYVAPLPEAIVCDHDAEGRATLEAHLHLRTVPATKAILEGIDAVKVRLKIQGDNKARLMFMRGECWEEDKDLKEAKQPLSTVQEIDSYIWRKPKSGATRSKEEPIDEYNHGMDAMRYLVCYLDGLTGGNDPRGKEIPSEAVATSMVMAVKQNETSKVQSEQDYGQYRNRQYTGLTRRDKVRSRSVRGIRY